MLLVVFYNHYDRNNGENDAAQRNEIHWDRDEGILFQSQESWILSAFNKNGGPSRNKGEIAN